MQTCIPDIFSSITQFPNLSKHIGNVRLGQVQVGITLITLKRKTVLPQSLPPKPKFMYINQGYMKPGSLGPDNNRPTLVPGW